MMNLTKGQAKRLGRQIRVARENKRVEIADLAVSLGRRVRYLNRIEQGLETTVDRDTLEALATQLFCRRADVCIAERTDEELLLLFNDLPVATAGHQPPLANDALAEEAPVVKAAAVQPRLYCLVGFRDPDQVTCSRCRRRFACYPINER